MEFKTVKLKRLWNKLASTRSYIVDQCIKDNVGIRFELETTKEYMELTPELLKTKSFQTNKTLQKSRFGTDYYLIDFAWKPTMGETTD